MQEASQACDVAQTNVMSVRRSGLCSPVHGGANPDMCIAPVGSESGVCDEITRQVVKLVPEDLAK